MQALIRNIPIFLRETSGPAVHDRALLMDLSTARPGIRSDAAGQRSAQRW